MPYLALFRHQCLRRLRAPRPRLFWLAVLLGSLMLVYAFIGVIFLGLGAEILVHEHRPGLDPTSVVNSLLPGAALGLLVVRFLFGRPPVRDLPPYLSLPLKRTTLARFALLSATLSLHNLLPLAFAVAFSLHTLVPLWGARGAAFWLGGFVGVLVLLDVATLFLRTVLGGHAGRFLALVGGAALLLALDVSYGPQWSTLGGWVLFTALASGSAWTLAGLWAVVLASAAGLVRYLSARLAREQRRSRAWTLELRFAPNAPVWNLIRLETALILRHKRPRQFVFISLLFSTVYTVLLLRTGEPSAVTAVLLGFMSSGMFALNYGPLMFGWESSYFDGIVSRPTALLHVLVSKGLLLQLSCGVLFLVALPFFLLWAPSYVGVHAAMMVYNAGVCVPFVLALALGNREPIALQRSSMFNYQGVSFKHMAWSLVLGVPPLAAAVFVPDQAALVPLLLGAAGFGVSLLLLTPATHRFARVRYDMARAFRSQSL